MAWTSTNTGNSRFCRGSTVAWSGTATGWNALSVEVFNATCLRTTSVSSKGCVSPLPCVRHSTWQHSCRDLALSRYWTHSCGFRGRRGVVKLRSLGALATPLAESPGESWTRLAIHDDDIPAPEPQHWVEHGGVQLFRLDLAWPRSRVAVEYDGEEWHDRTPEQGIADQARRTWLGNQGWTVIVVKKHQFKGPARDAWLREVRLALGLAW